jgi:hypothetical protein
MKKGSKPESGIDPFVYCVEIRCLGAVTEAKFRCLGAVTELSDA